MKTIPIPNLQYLNECFELDDLCLSGLRWKERPLSHFSNALDCNMFNCSYCGSPVVLDSGKEQICLDGQWYRANRMVYCLYNNTIDIEGYHIDHIDQNPKNNKPDNLRLATPSQNSGNGKVRSNSKSGVRGVSWNKNRKKWRAIIMHQGKYIEIGFFEDLQEAAKAYNEAAVRLRGEFCGILNKVD